MIKIDDRYLIKADNYNTILYKVKDPSEVDPKTKARIEKMGKKLSDESTLQAIGYYMDVESALQDYLRKVGIEKISSDEEISLNEYISQMNEILTHVRFLIKGDAR